MRKSQRKTAVRILAALLVILMILPLLLTGVSARAEGPSAREDLPCEQSFAAAWPAEQQS